MRFGHHPIAIFLSLLVFSACNQLLNSQPENQIQIMALFSIPHGSESAMIFLGLVAVLGTVSWFTWPFRVYSWVCVRTIRPSETDGIIFMDKHNRVTQINDAAAKILLLDRKNVKGYRLENVLSRAEHSKLRKVIETGQQGGKTGRGYIAVFSEGKPKQIMFDVVPVANLLKHTIGCMILLFAVSEEEQAERKSVISESVLRQLLDASTEIMFVVDRKGTFVGLNNATAERRSKSVDELIGTSLYDFLLPEQVRTGKSHIDKVFQTGEPVHVEENYAGRYFAVGEHPVFNDRREVESVAVFAMDMTEYRHSAEEARSNEQMLQSLLNAIFESAFLIDTEGRILVINETAAKRLGKSVEALTGQCIYDFLPSDVSRSRKANVDEVIRSKRGLIHTDLRDGRYYDDSIFPVLDPHGSVVRIAVYAQDTTEHRRMDEALRQSEAKYRSLFESVGIAIAIIEKDGTIGLANAKCEEVTGYDRNDVVGKMKWEDLIASEDLDRLREYRRKRLARDVTAPTGYECHLLTKSGEKRDIIAGAVATGESNQTIVSFIDITARKQAEEELKKYRYHLEELVKEGTAELTSINEQLKEENVTRRLAEEALRRSEERYRMLAEASQDMIYIVDARGTVQYVNNFAAGKINRTAEEIAGKTLEEILPPEEAEKRGSILREALTAGKQVHTESKMKFPTGEIWMDTWLVPMKNEMGEVTGVLGVSRDISDIRRTQEKLIETTSRLNHLLTYSPMILYSSSATGDFPLTYISDNIGTQMGYTSKEALEDPKFWVTRIHPADLKRVLSNLDNYLYAQGYTVDEYRFRHKDGSYRWMHDESKLVRDVYGNPVEVIGLWIDVTGRRHVEKALSDAKENLQTLGNFATYMIHDLKNPLAGIKILADDLHNRLPAEQVLRKYTAEILIGVKRMEELINKTLDFARPTQLNLEIINLHDLIEEAVSEVSPANLSVEKHYNYLPDTVKADGRRLKRVFFNIILNAVQATPGGGTLSILTEGTDSGPKIAITDTGEGIPKDRVAQVFNPFFTTREDGHGLGLAFAKQIVTAHGGEISIESQEGEGTTVTIIIPSDETKPS